MIGVSNVFAEFEAWLGGFLHGHVPPSWNTSRSAAAVRPNFVGAWNFA
jgi:hypothetical protein